VVFSRRKLVKIMRKMHQNRLAMLGELKRSPDPLAAIWGLLLREEEGGRGGRGGRGGWEEGRGVGEKREFLSKRVVRACVRA